MSPRPLLDLPILMLVTDRRRAQRGEHTGTEKLDDVAREASLGGVNCVQLREKDISTAELVRLGLHVRDAVAGRALLLVNGDAEAAHALDAGLHLPERGLSVAAARAKAGEYLLISCAVHSTEAAIRAAAEGADLLVAGTLFETNSKPGAATLGKSGLRRIADAVEIPVIAIGGVKSGNAGEAIRAGASGVAVITAIMDAQDPRAAAAELRAAIDAAWTVR